MIDRPSSYSQFRYFFAKFVIFPFLLGAKDKRDERIQFKRMNLNDYIYYVTRLTFNIGLLGGGFGKPPKGCQFTGTYYYRS